MPDTGPEAVARFDIDQQTEHMGNATMQQFCIGDWVRFTDYEALAARLAEVEATCERFARSHERHLIAGAETRQRAEAAEAELAAATKIIEMQDRAVNEARAAVGAAIEKVAARCDEHARHEVGREAAMLKAHAAYFRALRPDATASLQRMLREARNAALDRAAAEMDTAAHVMSHHGTLADQKTYEHAAKLIRTMKEQPE